MSKYNLHNEGKNPYYEGFTAKDAALLKMVLDTNEVPYEIVDHSNGGSLSRRYYIEKKNEEWIESEKAKLVSTIQSGVHKAQFEYEFSQAKKYINTDE